MEVLFLYKYKIDTMSTQSDIDGFNRKVTQWAEDTQKDVRAELDALRVVHAKYSRSPVSFKKALKAKLRLRSGEVSSIGISFPRHGVFVHKGVGKGTPVSRIGTTKRKAKPFLNPVLDKNLVRLSEIAADHMGNITVNSIKIK